jgi:phenylacetate-CoA ligase
MNWHDFRSTLNGLVTIAVKRAPWVYPSFHRFITRTQWYTASELAAFQLSQLRRVVSHAWATVPAYRTLMQGLGITPQDINTLGDITKFPIISKQHLKRDGPSYVSTAFCPKLLFTAHTGGTSGVPVPIKRDMASIAREHAFVRRQFRWAGLTGWDRCAYLEGRRIRGPASARHPPYHYDAATRELTLSTFHLEPATIQEYVKLMTRYRIVALIAYPSAAYVLAKHSIVQGRPIRLRCVLTTSETLSIPQRTLIGEAFSCPVFDVYGSAERVVYVHTCEKGRYHIVSDYGYTELVPAALPNQDCYRVIATGFWNMAMPLIRYDMGDLVRLSRETCSCGRAFPIVHSIIGRDGNTIVTPGGVELGASAIECILAHILYTMYDMPVFGARVCQERPDLLVLDVIPGPGFGAQHESRLLRAVSAQAPPGVRGLVRCVERIERTARGKWLSFARNEYH